MSHPTDAPIAETLLNQQGYFLREDIAPAWSGCDAFRAASKQGGVIYRDKEGRRTLRFEQNGHGYFLKLHQGVGWGEIVKNLWQGRLPILGAENEYLAIRAFERLGIDTLSIAGYGKRGHNPAKQLSFLITDELLDVETLEDICARWPQQPPSFALKQKLLDRVAHIARTMHENGINHRDFYLCHFLIQSDNPPINADNIDGRKIFLMDLHRAQIRQRVPPRWLIKDIGGLYYSALNIGLSKRDILRFIRAYTQTSLREQLEQHRDFWTAVRERACRIYVRDYRCQPQSDAWFSSEPMLDAFLLGDRQLITPTTLRLKAGSDIHFLHVDAVLRLLPKKRLVLRGRIGDKSVVVKLFVRSQSSARHIQREQAGHQRVVEAGVKCPRLIGDVTTTCDRFEGVMFEFIDAPALSTCWEGFDTAAKKLWLQRMLQTMLSLHRAGAYQSDIHADNFLLCDEQFYLLDLGSIVCVDAPLAREKSIANIGALIAQFTLAERELFCDAIADYRAQRQWHDDPNFEKKLSTAIDEQWQLRKQDYLKKALRECKLTAFTSTFSRVQAVRRDWLSTELKQLCASPDIFMNNGRILKAGNTATVVKATLDGKPVIIKRYNIKNWRHAISRALRPTRAEHSWLYAHWLELAGIESMRPIAFIEKRFGPFRSTAYFVGSWVDGGDLLSVGQQRALTSTELIAVQELLDTMCTAQLSHGDFKANNLLLCGDRVALIDLDAMHEHTNIKSWCKAFRRDLSRLQRNWASDSQITAQIRPLVEFILRRIENTPSADNQQQKI